MRAGGRGRPRRRSRRRPGACRGRPAATPTGGLRPRRGCRRGPRPTGVRAGARARRRRTSGGPRRPCDRPSGGCPPARTAWDVHRTAGPSRPRGRSPTPARPSRPPPRRAARIVPLPLDRATRAYTVSDQSAIRGGKAVWVVSGPRETVTATLGVAGVDANAVACGGGAGRAGRLPDRPAARPGRPVGRDHTARRHRPRRARQDRPSRRAGGRVRRGRGARPA